jgi:hypothetical protein
MSVVNERGKGPFLLQFHISLVGIKPPIWRRFTVPSTMTFKKLHEVIQVVMGWENEHLFEFKYGPYGIGIPDDDLFFMTANLTWDARYKKLPAATMDINDKLTYVYDFGDDWVHRLRIEKIEELNEHNNRIQCIAGKRACPPEDVGGPYGYELHLEALMDENHPEHESAVEWRGPFDPNHFDLNEVNEALNKAFARKPSSRRTKG